MKAINAIAFVITLGILAGCIPVDNLEDYWNKGKVDQEIVGHWKKQGVAFRSQDEYISFENTGDHYLFFQTSASMPQSSQKMISRVKSIELGDHKFLIIMGDNDLLDKMMSSDVESHEIEKSDGKPERGTSGGLQRYSFKDGVLTLFFLDEAVLHEAIESGEITGKLPKRNAPDSMDLTLPTLASLDEKTVRFLIQTANDPKKWTRVERYTKVDDFENSIKESRAYPATKNTKKNTLINVILPDLEYFANRKNGILQRYLQTSPEWKVFEERGEIICYKREKIDDHWNVSLNGYRSTGYSSERLQTRYLFRFAKKGGGAFTNEYNRDETIVVHPLVGPVQLNLKSSDQGIESYIVIGQEGTWFEFFEQSKKESRTHTREALEWLERFLRKIRKAEDEIRQNGFVSKLMLQDGVREGKPILKVEDSFQPGIFDICGLVNPGAAGQVYLKVFKVKNGKQLSENSIFQKSNEYIGWSKNPDILFSYNSHITVYEGDWNHQYEARFELWHRLDTGKEMKLVEKTRMVYGWEK